MGGVVGVPGCFAWACTAGVVVGLAGVAAGLDWMTGGVAGGVAAGLGGSTGLAGACGLGVDAAGFTGAAGTAGTRISFLHCAHVYTCPERSAGKSNAAMQCGQRTRIMKALDYWAGACNSL